MVVGGSSHVREVVGSNPSTGYALDIFHIFCKSCIACLKGPKINEEEAGAGPFFQKNTKLRIIFIEGP